MCVHSSVHRAVTKGFCLHVLRTVNMPRSRKKTSAKTKSKEQKEATSKTTAQKETKAC